MVKFTYISSPESKTWTNKRYLVQIQHVREAAANFIVFIGVNDSGDGQEYTPIYPRFETTGYTIEEAAYNAGSIAEALVREMRKLKENVALTKVEKLLQAIKQLLETKMNTSKIIIP